METPDFATAFAVLTGNAPFPWQQELYRRFVEGKIPTSCDLPTGLGKTSVIALWLIALANHPDRLPRRLVYVVNRRTVVDQTTTEVEKLRENLRDDPRAAALLDNLKKLCAIPLEEDELPLAISTLRGQFADNREWSADPARPAVVAGTVDMIGSRLLFSGYRVGFKGKPLHAGFLGQDALLVHDEAHLEPAFQELIETIQREQCKREWVGPRPPVPCWRKHLQIMALTATSRNEDSTGNGGFELTEAEKSAPMEVPDPPTEPLHIAWRRLKARKAIHFLSVEDEKKELVDTINELALSGKFKGSGQAILIYARTVENAEKIVDKLNKAKQQVQQLTGTMRGLERDDLPKDRLFTCFLPASSRPDGVTPAKGTVYLVCTSAGEVGVNLSADHLICDLTTFESMSQRFGRVNRFGDRADTEIHVVHPKKFDENDPYEQRRKKTLRLLQQLNGDASPAALSQLDLATRQAAFALKPDIPLATDVLFDSWALTTIHEELPGRPPIEPYLHGIPERELPETHVAWREDVELLRNAGISDKQLGELLADYPLKPHELLRDRSDRVFKRLHSLADEHGSQMVWLIDDHGEVKTVPLGKLLENKERINWVTVVLPPSMGGLAPTGTLGKGAAREQLDVADELYQDGEQHRKRIWDDDRPPPYMRLVRTIDTNPEADQAEEETADRRFWHWYVRPKSADDDGSKTASQAPVKWGDHTDQVTIYAKNIAAKLCLPPDLHRALELAGRSHDFGKKRELWQRSIGNPNPTDWHAKSGKAKSGKDWKPLDITDYRHEFGSLLDVRDNLEFQELSHDLKDLVLHLIAAHHGRGRPHFPPEEAFDPEPKGKDVVSIAAEVPRRFAQLQRKYGRWGLAYLESLLRAADYAASARPFRTGGNP